MELYFWIVIAFLCTYEPIYGYFDYQKFKEKVRIHSGERVKYYKKIMIGLWVPTLFILGLVLFGPITLQDIGIKGVSLHTETLGKWVTYITLGLFAVYTLALIYYLIGSKVSVKMRNEIAKAKQAELEKSKFNDIMPVSKHDKKVWTFVSWTAGITEEIIYRGFLLFALTQLFPDLSIWVILIVSSVLFGLAHTYQGWNNVIRTSIMGLFLALIYISLDSLIPVILFHFLADYIGKIGGSNDEGSD
ncbi:CPBP family intramembrane glutamic endopeptidase [Bacillus sp. 31A1R]|uniref:CPBP family intramembrane glutamic endopeptidase n=1 Tax=Robertmurraya mangrovi TaxID=3098077 RepID=A0ABU5J1R0_9BACI|nr:CPBP family intramembrane glutamic endopeptidase [Bacillus sp. 31A1R]MDZ5473359.1 CPBP family intramembrane glutamic endopeptidase [Bacillus sp. 31A1R]